MCNSLRLRKGNFTAQERVFILILEGTQHRPRITRQAANTTPVHSVKDIAGERILKLPVVLRRKSGEISALAAIKRLSELPHPFRNCEVADAHLP